MIKNSRRGIIAFGIAVMLAIVPCAWAQEGKTARVKFPKGRNSVLLKGAAVRGTEDRYILRASQGQTMTLRITSTEDNAVFDVVGPEGSTPLISEATNWSGELPVTGDYTIIVGGTRGNATYQLRVTIR